MIKKLFIAFSLIFLSTSIGWAHDHVPYVKEMTFGQLTLRYLNKVGNYSWLGEIDWDSGFQTPRKSIRFGFKYRFSSQVKFGLYYKHQWHVRRDDNWQKNTSDVWFWSEPDNKCEGLIIPEFIYRWVIASAWVGEFRTHLSSNLKTQDQTFIPRLGATYFWTKNGQAFMNIYFHLERFVPLNFGNGSSSENWVYFGFLHHLAGPHKWGLNYRYGHWVWTPSEAFNAEFPDEDYNFTQNGHFFGVNYTYSH